MVVKIEDPQPSESVSLLLVRLAQMIYLVKFSVLNAVIYICEILVQILLTGKAINFLRQVCQDRTLVRSREAIRVAETSQGLYHCIICFVADNRPLGMINNLIVSTWDPWLI